MSVSNCVVILFSYRYLTSMRYLPPYYSLSLSIYQSTDDESSRPSGNRGLPRNVREEIRANEVAGEEASNEAAERRRLHNEQQDRRERLQRSTARHAHRAPTAQANGQRIQTIAARRALEQRRLEALPPCAYCGRRRHRCLARMIESSLRNVQLPPHAVARPSDSLLRISNRNRTARAILFARATTLLHDMIN